MVEWHVYDSACCVVGPVMQEWEHKPVGDSHQHKPPKTDFPYRCQTNQAYYDTKPRKRDVLIKRHSLLNLVRDPVSEKYALEYPD